MTVKSVPSGGVSPLGDEPHSRAPVLPHERTTEGADTEGDTYRLTGPARAARAERLRPEDLKTGRAERLSLMALGPDIPVYLVKGPSQYHVLFSLGPSEDGSLLKRSRSERIMEWLNEGLSPLLVDQGFTRHRPPNFRFQLGSSGFFWNEKARLVTFTLSGDWTMIDRMTNLRFSIRVPAEIEAEFLRLFA